MLILTRRIGESLQMGKEFEFKITVLGVKGNQVRIGIDAPKDVPIHREEIVDKIRAEKEIQGFLNGEDPPPRKKK